MIYIDGDNSNLKTSPNRDHQQPGRDSREKDGMKMAKFTVDVYGDTVCPWCYIGKKSLDAAIARHKTVYPDDEFQLKWRPYLLYPNAKISAYNKRDSIAVRFGPEAQTFLERVDRAGVPYAINFSWEGRTGSSRDSHKLILLAGDLDRHFPPRPASSQRSSPTTTTNLLFTTTTTTGPAATAHEGDVDPRPETLPSSFRPPSPSSPPVSGGGGGTTRQEAFINAVFHATLSQGHDVSSRAFLVPLALAHGLAPTADEVEAYLDSAGACARVERETARARHEIGVSAVPSYVVNGRFRVGGKQEPEVFLGVFERVRRGRLNGEGR